jgi:hypothetical protein
MRQRSIAPRAWAEHMSHELQYFRRNRHGAHRYAIHVRMGTCLITALYAGLTIRSSTRRLSTRVAPCSAKGSAMAAADVVSTDKEATAPAHARRLFALGFIAGLGLTIVLMPVAPRGTAHPIEAAAPIVAAL